MPKKKQEYGNDSITSLKGADRVRKRPAVIFGSDGLEGCEHSFFEILSNSIDEAREGYGSLIEVTRFMDRSIEVNATAAEYLLTITRARADLTGSLYIVNCTRAVSMTTIKAECMSTVWVLTVLARVQHSTAVNIWM